MFTNTIFKLLELVKNLHLNVKTKKKLTNYRSDCHHGYEENLVLLEYNLSLLESIFGFWESNLELWEWMFGIWESITDLWEFFCVDFRQLGFGFEPLRVNFLLW